MKIVYPDGSNRRPFNLADYMGKSKRSRENTNTNTTNNADLTYYKYYTGNFNKDGTAEFEIIRKEEGKKKNSSITLADLMRHRERKSLF